MGHYLAARWRGVHVEPSRIGFGRPLLQWTRPARHRLAARLDPARRLREAARAGDAGGRRRPRPAPPGAPATPSTRSRSADRAIVVAAGPVANFLLAACCSPALFATVGQPVGGTGIARWCRARAAARAGLLAGRPHRLARWPDGQPLRAGAALRPAARRPAGGGRACSRDGAELTLHRGAGVARRAPTARSACSASRAARRDSSGSTRSRRSSAGVVQTGRRHLADAGGHRRDDHRRAQRQGAGRAAPHRPALRPGRLARHRPADQLDGAALGQPRPAQPLSRSRCWMAATWSSTRRRRFAAGRCRRGRRNTASAPASRVLVALFLFASWNDIAGGPIGSGWPAWSAEPAARPPPRRRGFASAERLR